MLVLGWVNAVSGAELSLTGDFTKIVVAIEEDVPEAGCALLLRNLQV